MPFADYFASAVVEPLGLAGALHGSPAWGYRGPLDDLLELGRELLAPTLVAPETLDEATSVQFPGLAGVLPELRPDGAERLGPHVRAARRQVAALDGLAQLAAHVRALRRGRDVPLGRPGARPRVRRAHGPGVRRLGEGRVARVRATQSSAKSGRKNSSNVARSQLATTAGVIAVTVAVRGTSIASATSPK